MTAAARVSLVDVRNLSIRFPGNPEGNATLDKASLTIARGEIVALVGESGSGKSLLAHMLAGILTPVARIEADAFTLGGLDLKDRASPAWADVRGREVGIVFQNSRSALNPVRKVGVQIADVIAEHTGLRGRHLRTAAIDALTAVRIPDPARRYAAYPSELSGGMCQRIMIAIAMAGNPALLIADEPTTGLDTTTQAAILELILAQARSRQMACLLITHDLALAREFAERVLVMHAGQIVEQADTEDLFVHPRHPYAAALLSATPGSVTSVEDLQGIPGQFPDLRAAVPACRFAGRCERAEARCSIERPQLGGPSTHNFACWNPVP